MSGYNKQPFIHVPGFGRDHSFNSYDEIVKTLNEAVANIKQKQSKAILAIEFYPGVRTKEIEENIIKNIVHETAIYADDTIFETSGFISNKIKDTITDDRVFGIMSHYSFMQFINETNLAAVQEEVQNAQGTVILYGVGASMIAKPDILIYADMARWEIQCRYRNGELENWKADKKESDILKKFKRGYFFEWRMADRQKKALFSKMDFLLDTNIMNMPKMITAESYFKGLEIAARSPFRVVPYFDPGVWGGQWLKETCDLNRDIENYAWAFDCVPEENSLLFEINDIVVETPAINLVFCHPGELLGNKVYARFGAEFPIRFDILDTMGGENLSLQVHPDNGYAYDHFGISYTQDESYYMLEAGEDAVVYLGVKSGIDPEAFMADLQAAESGAKSFPAEEYVNLVPARKHDHFLIPSGTIHCSGKDTVVLEISATPYIFTFKLWDWDRLGLDGKPRPVAIEHGMKVVKYDRNTEWTYDNLVNQFTLIDEKDSCKEERTGLHELEFIETRRHTFSKTVYHNTNGGVNVLNLVEGDSCIVESPANAFEPYVIHYAETFIIPAVVGAYSITPYGTSQGKEIITIKAFVRE